MTSHSRSMTSTVRVAQGYVPRHLADARHASFSRLRTTSGRAASVSAGIRLAMIRRLLSAPTESTQTIKGGYSGSYLGGGIWQRRKVRFPVKIILWKFNSLLTVLCPRPIVWKDVPNSLFLRTKRRKPPYLFFGITYYPLAISMRNLAEIRGHQCHAFWCQQLKFVKPFLKYIQFSDVTSLDFLPRYNRCLRVSRSHIYE